MKRTVLLCSMALAAAAPLAHAGDQTRPIQIAAVAPESKTSVDLVVTGMK